MDKNKLIKQMHSRIGIEKLDKIIPEIDHLISNCIKFYARYKPLDQSGSIGITPVDNTYTFVGVIPSDIISVYDTLSYMYYTNYMYAAPVLSNVPNNSLLVQYFVANANISEFVDLPDLLEDYILGDYCKAIKTKMAVAQIPIEISLDASVLEIFIEIGNTAKEMIMEQKDYRLCLT